MHRKIMCLTVLMFAVILAGCNTSAKVAVINPEEVFQQSQAGKDAQAYLESLGAKFQKELMALSEEVEKDGDNGAAQLKFQQTLNEYQQQFGQEQQRVFTKVEELYNKAVDACRAKDNLDMVLKSDAVLSHKPEMDITKKVISEMDRTPVNFASEGEEKAQPAAPFGQPGQPAGEADKPAK